MEEVEGEGLVKIGHHTSRGRLGWGEGNENASDASDANDFESVIIHHRRYCRLALPLGVLVLLVEEEAQPSQECCQIILFGTRRKRRRKSRKGRGRDVPSGVQ